VRVLEFRLLGPLEVVDESRRVLLGGQKQRALLTALLLDPGRVVSTDRLVDVLWGAKPPRTAATSLHNFVSQLRKELGADVLETRPPGYVLRVQPEQVDVEQFRVRVAQARALPGEARAAALDDALALWRGDALADFRFDEWAQNEAERLEELRIAVVEERVDTQLELGGAAALVGELESLVDEHPLRERLRFQLMLALYRSGRQAEALGVYQEARRRLVDELGIEPGPQLQELHGAILRQEAGLELRARRAPADDHLRDIVDTILDGRVVPVLGSDVAELAQWLARRFDYPEGEGALPRIAQYVAVMKGSGPLYDELHELLTDGVPPTSVHRLFASLPPRLRARGVTHQLLVTTSWDTALEQAFRDAGEAFDVVSYLAAGPHRGKFCHVTPDGNGRVIDLPNTYVTELSLEERTVILKLHGQVERTDEREWESFVVTEDDYIDYLAQTELANALPASLAARLRRSHFLFLGYTMADWNLRVVLNRLWGDQPLSYRSWAVQPEPMQLEREFWRRRDVEVLEAPLEQYADALARHLDEYAEVAS
jgi:DNA-binding SARP family transcriptional activator